MDSLEHLANWVDPLLDKLSPRQRRSLLKQLAVELRRANQKRIAAQQSPEGIGFTPRKQGHRENKKSSQKKQPMFNKLRRARFIKLAVSPEQATIAFAKRAAKIAAVHHYGLQETENGQSTRYAARPLLGFSTEDHSLINDFFIRHLS